MNLREDAETNGNMLKSCGNVEIEEHCGKLFTRYLLLGTLLLTPVVDVIQRDAMIQCVRYRSASHDMQSHGMACHSMAQP